jgi:hypothetical protein
MTDSDRLVRYAPSVATSVSCWLTDAGRKKLDPLALARNPFGASVV